MTTGRFSEVGLRFGNGRGGVSGASSITRRYVSPLAIRLADLSDIPEALAIAAELCP